jgi:hypothetical protein
MTKEEKIEIINQSTKQSLTLEYIEEGARDYGITIDEMVDLMLEDVNQNKDDQRI